RAPQVRSIAPCACCGRVFVFVVLSLSLLFQYRHGSIICARVALSNNWVPKFQPSNVTSPPKAKGVSAFTPSALPDGKACVTVPSQNSLSRTPPPLHAPVNEWVGLLPTAVIMAFISA
ncbi:unnamed protein product, partial [Ectocarpus sp. 6 AP-2014]